jgi:hypothetical protein
VLSPLGVVVVVVLDDGGLVVDVVAVVDGDVTCGVEGGAGVGVADGEGPGAGGAVLDAGRAGCVVVGARVVVVGAEVPGTAGTGAPASGSVPASGVVPDVVEVGRPIVPAATVERSVVVVADSIPTARGASWEGRVKYTARAARNMRPAAIAAAVSGSIAIRGRLGYQRP